MRNCLTRYLRLFGCIRTHRLLFAYAQGELDAATRRKLEVHLDDCPACLDFVETYRRTITATHRLRPAAIPIPEEMLVKLESFVASKF